MNKVLEYIEAQKLFKLSKKNLEILIHPESFVHAIIKFKNGLQNLFIMTFMIIPIANAIFENNFEKNTFFKRNKKFENLTFKLPTKQNFPIIKILDRVNEHPSTSIIINASNEVLVEHFLRKKLPFLGISTIIKNILRDRNYKKYAIKVPNNLKQINIVNSWARMRTLEMINSRYD